jgi:alkylated DNA repair dioxygenase AlkB
MDLFNSGAVTNVLPYDGDAKYYGRILKLQPARDYMQHLLQDIEWRNDELVMYGRHLVMQRKIAWYAEEKYDYTYSNTKKQSQVWTPQLLKLKQLVEAASGHTFNSVLLNLYHSGQEGLSWHSDNEKEMGDQVIASLSFGAERIFAFKHKSTKQRVASPISKNSRKRKASSTSLAAVS